MRFLPRRKRLLFLFAIALIAPGFISFEHSALASNDVNVQGRVNFNPVIKVYPEKRVPIVNNWGNQAVIEIRNPGTSTPIFTQVIETKSDGRGTMQSIDVSMVPKGTYDIAVKGIAHLRRVYHNVPFVSNIVNVDLTNGGALLAGDLNSDNYVNSLDVSRQVRNIYTRSGDKSDLNRDGIVNSLDISNASTNMFLKGSR